MGGASGQGTTTYVVVALLCFSGWRAQGFVCPSIRSSPSVDQRRSLPCSREASRPLLLAVVPPGKAGGGGASSATAGGGTEENGAGFGASDKMKKKITSAPLRITPNFQPHEKRRPKTEINKDITRAFLTEDSFDIAGETCCHCSCSCSFVQMNSSHGRAIVVCSERIFFCSSYYSQASSILRFLKQDLKTTKPQERR